LLFVFLRIGNEDFIDYTVIACHPTEQLVACGDKVGKIVIVRNMFDRSRLVKQYYHWHASQVNTLCWSTLGRNFYSGGDQCVLVKWTLDEPLSKEFYPRMPGAIQHISTTVHSDNFAVSTSDNGIYMFKSNRLIGQIQNFTWISEDGTELNKFPAGMKINPRNTSLVLNGRAGHLQFYSPHTKNLLFNVSSKANKDLFRSFKREKLYLFRST
jgi:NET1-associated nuclear protein 1 (U3 small nucleolar RNA-associated protein 17)